MTEIPMIHAPSLPDDTFIIGAFDHGVRMWGPTEPLRITREVWWGPDRFPPPVEVERRAALDHLSGLLDGLCRRWGMDPEAAWREPRRWRQDTLAWRMEERVSMQVLNPRAHLIVTL